jgi:hypothetical protein
MPVAVATGARDGTARHARIVLRALSGRQNALAGAGLAAEHDGRYGRLFTGAHRRTTRGHTGAKRHARREHAA